MAGRGLNSSNNLKEIKNLGFEYVVAHKLKKSSKSFENYIEHDSNWNYKNDNFKYKKIENNFANNDESNLIISWSEKRFNKDLKDQERFIKKAQQFINNPSKFKAELKKGGKIYVNSDSKIHPFLNEKRFEMIKNTLDIMQLSILINH